MGKRERMSRKLDAWMGRSWKAAKLNSLLNLTVSRLAVLRHQRRVRRDHARSDVAELLRQGQQERALLRAEYVIKEENMLDAFAMVEGYCHVVSERSALLEDQNQRECPEELREAIGGLIFAESRCGELPELHEVRSILASRLGKEFVAAAVELRNNCGVNSRVIQKMSTKQASLESRTKVAKDFAAELGIAVQLEEPSSELPTPPSSTPTQPDAAAAASAGDVSVFSGDEYLSESTRVKERYKNAASAAQAAFESAAYAAAAARAAVELSRSESQGKVGKGDHSGLRATARAASGGRSYPAQGSSSETESEEEKEQSRKPAPFPGQGEKTVADDASEEDEEESEEDGLVGGELTGNQPVPPMQRQSGAPGSRNRPEHGFRAHREVGVKSDEDTTSEEEEEEEESKPHMAAFRSESRPARRQETRERSQDREPNRAEDRYRRAGEEGEGTATDGSETPTGRNVAGRTPVNRSGVGKGPISMRTRRSGF